MSAASDNVFVRKVSYLDWTDKSAARKSLVDAEQRPGYVVAALALNRAPHGAARGEPVESMHG